MSLDILSIFILKSNLLDISYITFDLQNSEKYTSILASNKQSSKEWLETNSLNYMKLSLKDLVEKGTKNKFVLYYCLIAID